MKGNPSVLSTGEAAKICGISQQQIIRLIDTHQLKGWRVPGSRFRRVLRATLAAFMLEHGVPVQSDETAAS